MFQSVKTNSKIIYTLTDEINNVKNNFGFNDLNKREYITNISAKK